MPRGARLDAPGTLHHVMVRGIEGNSIVADDEDRLVMILRDEQYIREVIAFPMNQQGQYLMMNAPSEVLQQQLRETEGTFIAT